MSAPSVRPRIRQQILPFLSAMRFSFPGRYLPPWLITAMRQKAIATSTFSASPSVSFNRCPPSALLHCGRKDANKAVAERNKFVQAPSSGYYAASHHEQFQLSPHGFLLSCEILSQHPADAAKQHAKSQRSD